MEAFQHFSIPEGSFNQNENKSKTTPQSQIRTKVKKKKLPLENAQKRKNQVKYIFVVIPINDDNKTSYINGRLEVFQMVVPGLR
jgi:hypothetical protein